MEIQNSGAKRKIGLIATIVCCIAILTAGTLAYFNAEETAVNVITTGNLSMKLHEEAEDGKPFPSEGVFGVMPDTDVAKKAYVENTGSVDMYVRIAIEKEIQGESDRELGFENITLDLNTADWTEQDGYYYYNRALKPGEKTEPLFTMVRFDKEMGNEYMNARLTIKVNAQAVQSRNNTDSALTAAGWPEA
ncbi:MAG: TasA family protein [Candidatus Faecivicinus sp.]|nr:TasA family protein [Candidatus Faecivicinus sp.]